MSESEEKPEGFVIHGAGTEPFKIAQALYHAVTGKTESISKQFSENYQITFDDLKQLHAKFEQMCSQWKMIGQSECITLFHINDNKEVFTSIQRLEFYDFSKNNPIESITFEFNVLLNLPDIDKAQPYKITIRMVSRIAAMHRAEMGDLNKAIFWWMRTGVIHVDIKYVDYVVARNIFSTIDSWINGIAVAETRVWLKTLQKFSHWVPRTVSLIFFLLAVYVATMSTNTIFFPAADNEFLAKYLISAFGFVIAFFFMGNIFGRLLEYSIDRLEDISYIKINRGDKKLLSEFKQRNSNSAWHALFYLLLITGHAIACSYIGTAIFETIKVGLNNG